MMKTHCRTPMLLASFLVVLSLFPTSRAQPVHSVKLDIKVDLRIELLTAVQLLAGYGDRYGLIADDGSPYQRAMEQHFAEHKGHRAVTLFREMAADGFTFDAPPAAMLHLSDPPDLAIAIPMTEYLAERAGGENRLDTFVAALRDFARDTDFTAFFERQHAAYDAFLEEARMLAGRRDYIGPLERYYGLQHHSYTVVLAPLFVGSYGPRVLRADGSYDVYNVTSHRGMNADGFMHLAWHEFGHSFANPIVDSFRGQLAQYAALYEPIAEQMRRQAYPQWHTCVYEHIVRAVVVRLVALELGDDKAGQRLQYEADRGFVYVEALCDRLRQYENNREEFPTLRDFFPQLMDVFAQAKPADASAQTDFRGPINAVVGDYQNVVVVVPTHEADKDVQQAIADFAAQVRDMFFLNAPVLTDEEALKQDLADKGVLAYGTITGNAWTAALWDAVPIRIEPDKVVADKVYEGAELRVITAWPNPQNPKRGVIVYTAQRAEDVVGINNVFHGPTDYVVARGIDALQSGNYAKTAGKWSLNQEGVVAQGAAAAYGDSV